MTDAGLVSSETLHNRTYLSVTEEGRETLNFFRNRIVRDIREEIDTYIRENEYTLRNEFSILARYDKAVSGEYHPVQHIQYDQFVKGQ